MKVTLISHFLNEEILLPYWLDHHKGLVDMGIMIDHGSTDNSVDIIGRTCPHWKVIPTVTKEKKIWHDVEVMNIESEIDGWKLVLNTTEFLVTANLKNIIRIFVEKYPSSIGFRTEGVVIFENERPTVLDDRPLLIQKTFGLDDPEDCWGRRRLIHCAENGNYKVGRHETNHPNIPVLKGLYVSWFGSSGFPDIKKLRSKSIGPIKNPQFDRSNYDQTDEEVERHYAGFYKGLWYPYIPFDLRTISTYDKALNNIARKRILLQ